MTITLINPPAPLIESYYAVGITAPPLGIAYLAAALEGEEHAVKIVDAQALGLSVSQIKREIEKSQPELVGVTSTTPTIYEALAVIKAAKEACPNAFTVLGGPHASFLPFETLRECGHLDAVCIGEGEETILDLVRAIRRKEGLSNVKGIAYRSGDSTARTQPRPLISDLDSLPFPARHLLPMEKYKVLDEKRTIGHLMTSRGCPFNCTFCSSSLLFGKRLRCRSPENVVDEIEQVISEYNIETIEFADDEFTLNRRRTEDICGEMKRRGVDITWACSSRVDTVSKALLQKMKEAGCYLIFYGVESSSQRILNLIKKGVTVEQIVNAIKWTKEAGIKVLGSFMLGFPDETREEIKRTIKFAKKLQIDYAQFSLVTPYPGTELYNTSKSRGLLLTEDWSQYTAGKPSIATKYCSKEDLIKLFRRAYTSFYLSPRILLHNLRTGSLSLFIRAVRSAFNLRL
jgi:anaerobic magnesium-protoporphyrin IX monomethyl ester cyclase